MPIQYHNFDLLIERSGDNFKARVLESPAGEATAIFHLPFPPSAVENFFVQIGHTRLIETSQMQKMRAFGQELFEAAFTGNVRDKFRESLSEANRNREGLRIRLRIADVPELANMPWEFMYDSSLSRFLTLSIETPLVRYLDVPRDIQPLTIRPPLQILAVISSPRDFPSLNVQREWDNLQEALTRLENRKLVQLTRLEKPTLQSLQRQFRRGGYHIFHFIGHGIYSKQKQDGQLLFEDELRSGDPVSSQDLGILLHDHRHLRLAVLNACEGARTSIEDQFSGTAQNLIRQGLPAVIAMQLRITDIAAVTLAREFYAALADGYPVDAALTEARKSIKTHGNDLEWGTPVLYMRSPNGQIFDVESINRAPTPDTKIESIADAEKEKQIALLYTEGLEAFYLKEWEKAVTKFKSILAIQSNHKDAAAKIKIAQHQLKFSNLDQQAQSAESKGEWTTAIKALEALTKEFPEKASLSSRLENARKQQRLMNLYSEANQLSKAKKWLAVVQVFHEIHSLDENYPDPDNLLSRANDESAAQKLQTELESLYQTALQAIDANNWQTAQDILRNIQTKQRKYRQTEKLLQRVESEIARIEKQKQEEEQVSSLYVQAENLAARKQWNKSLEKIEEILKIQPSFDDPNQVASQARAKLEEATQETEKQDRLATLYAEAVKLNQAGEYQQALDIWNQIRVIDSKYPDRQRVYKTAQRMFKKTTQSESVSEKFAWRTKFTPGWGILLAGVLWYAIRLGTLSITGLFEISNSAISELIRWSLFGTATGLLNLLVFHFFKFNVSNRQKIILIGGWFVGSFATPLMVWLFPESVFRYYIGYTLTGAFYGLVLHYTLPDFLYRPKLSTLIFSFAFGMFAGDCTYTWFRDSAGIAAPHYSALTLGVAALISGSLAFGKTIIAHTESKSNFTIEKAILSIAGILIAARWLGSVIGGTIDGIVLEPLDINWDTSPYVMTNLYFGLFAIFSIWFLTRFLRDALTVPITRNEMIILTASWISGMVVTSLLCAYLGIELEEDWGWRIGWGVGGLIVGLGMWLTTKIHSLRSKSMYLLTSILGWGIGFFIGEQISWPIQSSFIRIFGEDFGWNIAVNANVGIAGLIGGSILLSQLEIGKDVRINWKTAFGATLGFGLGNLLTNIVFSSFDEVLFLILINLVVWGFLGGATLAVPSKNYRRFVILGLLGGFGLALGYLIWTLLGGPEGTLAIILGAMLGLCLGIGTKSTLKTIMLFLTGAIAYSIRGSIANLYYGSDVLTSSTMEITVFALSAGLLGLILGTAWSFLNTNAFNPSAQ